MRTAIDIVLEGVGNGSITNDDAKILLEAINQKGGTQFIPVPYENPNPYSPPYRPGDVNIPCNQGMFGTHQIQPNTNTTTSDNTNG